MPSETVLVAFIAAVATLVASLGATALAHQQQRRREERRDRAEREERVRALTARRIEATRQSIDALVRTMAANAVGDHEGAQLARRQQRRVMLDADVALLGQASLVEAYQALLVGLRDRYGRGLDRPDQVAMARVQQQLDDALVSQLERLLRGEPLLVIPEDERAGLFEVAAFAQRMRVPRQRPRIAGRLARVLMERQVPKG